MIMIAEPSTPFDDPWPWPDEQKIRDLSLQPDTLLNLQNAGYTELGHLRRDQIANTILKAKLSFTQALDLGATLLQLQFDPDGDKPEQVKAFRAFIEHMLEIYIVGCGLEPELTGPKFSMKIPIKRDDQHE